jgi:hypothetical protein
MEFEAKVAKQTKMRWPPSRGTRKPSRKPSALPFSTPKTGIGVLSRFDPKGEQPGAIVERSYRSWRGILRGNPSQTDGRAAYAHRLTQCLDLCPNFIQILTGCRRLASPKKFQAPLPLGVSWFHFWNRRLDRAATTQTPSGEPSQKFLSMKMNKAAP